jgi:hypothetical protein
MHCVGIRARLNGPRHAYRAVERSRGQLPITPEDIARLPEILNDPDKVAFAKRVSDGSIIVLEETRNGRRRLALKSMRKVPAAANIESGLSTLQPDVRNVGGLRMK